MRDLFEKIRDGGEKEIKALEEGRAEEDLRLDFKQKASPDRIGFNADDKRIFAKALSGFSNSDGGLLVFGIDCREGKDGVDCVQGLDPIAGIDKFASDARGMVSSLLSPANDGIEVIAVNCDDRLGYGYLLVWAPKSDSRPHQSRAAGEFKYYRRTGRDFVAMEHYEVEDMMMRRSAPNLEIKFIVETGYSNNLGDAEMLLLKICLLNAGRVSAKHSYLQIGGAKGADYIYSDSAHTTRSIEEGWETFVVNDHFIIHPGMTRTMATCRIELGSVSGGRTVNGVYTNNWCVSFQYRFGCEDVPMIEANATLNWYEIVKLSAEQYRYPSVRSGAEVPPPIFR